MGLFSFFSRKPGIRAKSGASLRAQPYETATAGPLPTRGGYPITNSGPTIADSLPSGRSGFSESRSSLETASEDDQPAPAPGIPRCREESVDRPSTAPNSRPTSTIFASGNPLLKRNGQKQQPPLSFRMARPETPVRSSRPGSRNSMSTITTTFPRTSGQSRANSLRSDGGRAFKDILDAQSEIKPADFRTRVQAAGARDYGEDVAERNMGQNGVDLDATHVRAFYAQSEGIHGPRRRASLMETGPRAGRAGVRRRSLLSIQHTPPRHPMPPSPKRNGTRDLGRRRSVNTYMPLDYGGENLLPRSDRDTLAALPPRVCGPGAKQLDFGFSALGLAAPSAAHALETAPAPIVRTTRRPRDSVVLAKQRVLETTAEDAVGEESFALWSATRSHRSSTVNSAPSLPRRHHSVNVLRSPLSSSALGRDANAHVTPLSHPPKTGLHGGIEEEPESPARPATAHHSSVRSFPLVPTRPAATTAHITLPDDESLGYPPPIRTRSMRGWSASSETPTAPESIAATSITTTTSTFHRPPSLHTADTSVDLSIGAGSPQLKHSRSFSRPGSAVHDASSDYDTDEHTQEVRLRDAEGAHRLTRPISEFNIDDYLSSSSSRSEDDDGDNDNLHHPLNPNKRPTTTTTTTDTAVHHNLLLLPELQQQQQQQPPPQSNPHPATNSEMDEESHDRDHFNIDDYLSSDAASMTTPNRRPTAEGEEELLFDDGGGFGFGAGGEVGLPGLGEALPFPLPCVEQQGGGGGLRDADGKGEEEREGEVAGMVRASVRNSISMSAVGLGARRERSRDELGMGGGVRPSTAGYDWGAAGRGGCWGEGAEVVRGADGRKNGQAREEGWHRETRMRRRYVLDTAADEESESEFDSDWGREGGVGGRRRRHLHGQPDGRPRTAHMDADSDEDGYEADFVDDDDYDEERQTRRRNGNRQTERLSALCRLEGREDEARRQLSQQNGDLEDKVTAAVRLRKEAKRARRLAGQPSPAMLRRKASGIRRMGTSMPVPVLHIDGAAV